MRDGTDSLFFIWVGIEAGFAVRVRQIRYPGSPQYALLDVE